MLKNKKTVKRLVIAAVAFLLAAFVVGFTVFSFASNKLSRDITVAEAQQIVDETLSDLPKVTAKGAKYIIESSEVKVESIKRGDERNFELSCSYNVLDAAAIVSEHKQELIDEAYAFYQEGAKEGKKPNATKISQKLADKFGELLKTAKPVSGEIKLYVYEVNKGEFTLYLSDEAVDACTGGMAKASAELGEVMQANYGGKVVDITNSNTLRTGVKDCIALKNYDSEKPITGNFVVRFIREFRDEFERNFIAKNQWLYLLEGLGTTLAITGAAGLVGVILGFIVAIVRCTNQTTGKLGAIDAVCRFYLTIIRGTPVMVQLLIIYFVLLLPIGVPKFAAAVICFGLNSGAYVAEIVRGGIMSVDKGQNEAGRSLGFNFPQTMWHFIVPQAFKAVLPALANEFITLLKESSVAFYIGVADLTQGGLKIRSITYSNFMPLIAVALIYLCIVLILTRLVGILERRLRKSEH